MIEALLKGLGLGLLLSISVGPVIFSIIKQSLNNGHKAGYIFVAGVSASDITLVLISNLFTQIFTTLLGHKDFIAIGGSIFLIGVGIYNLFFKKMVIKEEDDTIEKRFRKRDQVATFFTGYLMNTLNPGAFLFWFVWAATIVADAKHSPNPMQYRIVVFGTCLLFVLFTDILKVIMAGKLRSRLTPPIMHRINQLSGIILIGFGAALIYGILR